MDQTLVLLHKVVAAAVTSIVVTDPHQPDNPIVYHNPAFERISGYAAHEIDGYNCRFLQGPDTNPADVAQLRDAISAGRDCRVQILNYRKGGIPFWNELFVSPVRDASGRLTHFVGVQNDVTRRAEAERERDELLAQQQRIAETLQRALLLTPPPTALPGIEISTQYQPALDEAQFGGDFYDSFALGDGKVALVVGDLTGKGLQAAQHTAEVKFALRVLLREYRHPVAALHRLNTFLIESERLDAREHDALVCVTAAIVDTHTGEMQVTSAGMEPPLILRADGTPQTLEIGGALLGVDKLSRYRVEMARLEPGDSLILVTDGVTEARSGKRRFFGYDGLIEAAQAAQAKSAQVGPCEISAQIVERVRQFAGGKPQDDVCVLVARVMKTAPADVASEELYFQTRWDEAADAHDLARFALEVTGLGYWELDTGTGVARRSLRHDQIFGYDALLGDWTYARFLSHVHPDDQADVDARYGHALAAGEDWQFTCRIIRTDGKIVWIETRGRHFAQGNGDASRIVGTVADVTNAMVAKQRDEFLTDLAARTRFLPDPDAVVWETVQAVGAFLDLDRFMYADIDQTAQTVTVLRDYCKPGVLSVAGVWPLGLWGGVLDDFRAVRTVINCDYETDPRTSGDWETIYRQTDIRSNVTIPLFRADQWVAVFSAQSRNARDWTPDDVQLLESVAQQMWLVLENARLHQAERDATQKQRTFLRDILYSLTEGKLRLCSERAELPAELPLMSDALALSLPRLRLLRKQVEAVAEELNFAKERVQDLETSVGEAAMNAVVHGGGGTGHVSADQSSGLLQVWIQDEGSGIDEAALPRALEKGASSVGTLGHGFWLMLKTCDRLYLLTGADGTTVVVEQERTPPRLAWFEAYE